MFLHFFSLALVIDTRTSPILTIKHNKNRTTIYLPLSCISAVCCCHTCSPLTNLLCPQRDVYPSLRTRRF